MNNENDKMILKLENISVKYDNKLIVEDINLYLNEGELVCILGVSGSGKSTIFNAIAGLIKPDSGSIFKNDKDITGKVGNVSYMLQKDLLFPFKTIMENVILPMIIRGIKKKEAKEKAFPYFKQFGLEGLENKYPSELSGGMRQRVALLRTYMCQQEVFLLDEPFNALDAITKHKIHNWYLGIVQKMKMSTLFISHDIDEAILLSDRIYILKGKPGKIFDEIKIDLNDEKKECTNNSLGNTAIINSEKLMLNSKFLEYKRKILNLL